MPHQPRRILFVHYGDAAIRGSERCLLDLLKYLDRARFTPLVWCNGAALAAAAGELGVRVVRDDFPRPGYGFDPGALLRLVRRGLRLVDSEKIDLVHANSGAPNQWMNLVARLRGLPLLTHLHARYPLRERLLLGLAQSSLTVGVSQPVVAQLLGDGVPDRDVLVVPNGIDIEYQQRAAPVNLRGILDIPGNAHVLMTVASLIERKGIDLLLQAMRRLADEGLPAHLVVAGDGPQRVALQALAVRLRIDERVHFLGECSRVASLLRGGVDLFVSGAREEVFGLVLAEAGLAELPVIAPRVGGIPEVIEHNETGLLVAPESPHQLAAAASRLLRDPALRARLGRAGREKVLREFDIGLHARRMQAAYDELLADPARRLRPFSRWRPAVVLRRLLGALRIAGRHLFPAARRTPPSAAAIERSPT